MIGDIAPTDITEASRRRRDIARRILDIYSRAGIPPRAVLLAGSAGAGVADDHSDIDFIAYFDVIPELDSINVWRGMLGLPSLKEVDPVWGWGGGGEILEFEGVECEAGGLTAAGTEIAVTELLAGKNPASPLHQKIAQGLLDGWVLKDDGLIEVWRARLKCFPDGLAKAMAEHYLTQIYPYWKRHARMAAHDDFLFEKEMLVTDAFAVLGLLSAANRVYFSAFHLQRTRRHIGRLTEAPVRLAERLEGLFTKPGWEVAEDLRDLVSEAVAIAARQVPDLDVAKITAELRT